MKIAIIGLGYVGLPLALEFSKHFTVVGLDVDKILLGELVNGIDRTGEIDEILLKNQIDIGRLIFTDNDEVLSECYILINAVPTPVDRYDKPDLRPLINSSKTIGKYMSKGSIVVYESTVYPGATEEICVPILESHSKLKLNSTFFVGYSPERIVPGDKERTLTKIVKLVSASNEESLKIISNLYGKIITAGVFEVDCIREAEAAKVIENVQRDVNIALINEFSLIFNRLEINTYNVLKAAGTKWNFLKFSPGIVGGHCIGVDPLYLAQKAIESKHYPELLLTARSINNQMASFIAKEFIKGLIKKKIPLNKSKILILGFTFKENCSDIRNTKVIDIFNELTNYDLDIVLHDPYANVETSRKEYGVELSDVNFNKRFSAVILAVAHSIFKEDKRYLTLLNNSKFIYDLKNQFPDLSHKTL